MGNDARCCWRVKSFVLVREGGAVKAYPITNASDPVGTFPKMTITAMFGEAGRVGVVLQRYASGQRLRARPAPRS